MNEDQNCEISEQKTNKKCIITRFFAPIKWTLGLINKYFKSFIFLLILFLVFSDGLKDGKLEQANLATIDLHGAIMDAQEVVANIKDVMDDDSIKGVLLHVNSPGGALAPSVEIAHAVKALKARKPVIAYAAGNMTSGSYYASIWSDAIYSNPGSFIGSIGVIFQSYNVEELANKIGIKTQTIKAGTYKEAGTFMRKWTKKERQSLDKLINDAYLLFVSDVAKARGLKMANKETYADARVFLAKEAKKVGLIDKVGTLWDAQIALAKLAGVQKPIWQKKDKFEKMLEKLSKESVKSLLDVFYGQVLAR